jgi:hypothetical protein
MISFHSSSWLSKSPLCTIPHFLDPFINSGQVLPHYCICPRSKDHIWGRTCDFWSSESG